MIERICLVEGCGGTVRARSLCNKHYQAARQGKIPLPPTLHPQNRGKPCTIEWCDRPIRTGEYCWAHYQRARRGGNLEAPHRVYHGPICTIDGCEKDEVSRGYCSGHYARWREGRDMEPPIRIIDPGRGCAAEGCDREHDSWGYCTAHVARFTGKIAVPLDDPIRDGLQNYCDFAAAHVRVTTLWGKASQYPCIECGGPARDWAYDGTDPTELLGTGVAGGSLMRYSRFPEFYMPMCRKCHHGRDKGAAARELREYRILKYDTGLSIDQIRFIVESHLALINDGAA